MKGFSHYCRFPIQWEWASRVLVLCAALLLVVDASALDFGQTLLSAARHSVEWGAPDSSAEAESVAWFDKLQMRMGQDDSRDRKQTLAARLRLKTPGQRDAEQTILGLRSAYVELQRRMTFSADLVMRYGLLIDLDYQQRRLALLQREKALAQLSIQAMRNRVGSEDFRPDRLQTEELHMQALVHRIALAQQRLQQLKLRIIDLADISNRSADDLSATPLIAIEDLAQLLQPVLDDPAHVAGVKLKQAQLKVDIARQRLLREEKSKGLGLRFMQLSYAREAHRDDVYQLTVGIDLPVGGRDFAAAERRFQLNEAEYGLQRLRQEQADRQQLAQTEYELLLSEYTAAGQQLAGLQKRHQRQGAEAPVMLRLDLERELIEVRSRRLQLRREIYTKVIGLLQQKDLLAAEPLKNWLAPGQPPF